MPPRRSPVTPGVRRVALVPSALGHVQDAAPVSAYTLIGSLGEPSAEDTTSLADELES